MLLQKASGRLSQHLREELILSIAGILGMGEWFYPLFSEFLEAPSGGTARLLDFIAERERESRRDYSPLKELASNAARRGDEFTDQAADVLGRLAIRCDGVELSRVFSGTIANHRLAASSRYRFFIASMIVWFYFNR